MEKAIPETLRRMRSKWLRRQEWDGKIAHRCVKMDITTILGVRADFLEFQARGNKNPKLASSGLSWSRRQLLKMCFVQKYSRFLTQSMIFPSIFNPPSHVIDEFRTQFREHNYLSQVSLSAWHLLGEMTPFSLRKVSLFWGVFLLLSCSISALPLTELDRRAFSAFTSGFLPTINFTAPFETLNQPPWTLEQIPNICTAGYTQITCMDVNTTHSSIIKMYVADRYRSFWGAEHDLPCRLASFPRRSLPAAETNAPLRVFSEMDLDQTKRKAGYMLNLLPEFYLFPSLAEMCVLHSEVSGFFLNPPTNSWVPIFHANQGAFSTPIFHFPSFRNLPCATIVGPISPDIGRMTSLRFWYFEGSTDGPRLNQAPAPLPSEIGNLYNLELLYVVSSNR
jgi:hypothetical protein